MRYKIFGGIGALWGGAIVIRWLLADATTSGNAAYQSGQNGAVIFGAVMLVTGLYYFLKNPVNAGFARVSGCLFFAQPHADWQYSG